MWALKILTGPQVGQTYSLKPGRHKVGRGGQSQFLLQGTGVSKEHFEIHVLGDRTILTDLQSSNGTYVNGIRVQNAILRVGDKVSAHTTLMQVVSEQARRVTVQQPVMIPRPSFQPPPQVPGMVMQNAEIPSVSMPPPAVDWQTRSQNYLETAFYPSLYKMTEVFDLRQVVFGFAGFFVLLVTLLSVFPMKQITSESINTESRRRALTVARALASANEVVIRRGDVTNFRTDLVLREEGIDDVYVLSREGTIIAPAERAGNQPKELKFVKSIKGQLRDYAAEVEDGKIAAAAPILTFDTELQQNVAKAYAIVVYNPGSLAFDDGRAVSLFVQMLVIAGVLGFALFWCMYKVLEYPVLTLKKDLDEALREGRDQIETPFKFSALNEVLVPINSLLSRVRQEGFSAAKSSSQGTQDYEIRNLMSIMGYPAILLNAELVILDVNGNFESLTGYSKGMLMNQSLQNIPDQAMQKNISALLEQAKAYSGQLFSDQLELGGHPFKINCLQMSGYYLVTITPAEPMSEGGAA